MEAIHAACPFRHQPILDSIALVVEPLICRGFPNCYFLSGGGVTSLDPMVLCDSSVPVRPTERHANSENYRDRRHYHHHPSDRESRTK